MHIKASTIIPAGFKVTRCPPKEGKGKSVFSLLRHEEKKLEKQADMKRMAHRVAAAIKVGYTVQEAINLAKE